MTEDLNQYLANYTDFNDWLIRQRYELLKRYFRGTTCLELGPATGEGTEYLVQHFPSVVAVDGSEKVVQTLNERFAGRGFTGVHSYFEDLALEQRFDTVVLAHILEHVDDPQSVLAVGRRMLAPGGVMIVDVPNGMSLHRQVGVEMGLLGSVTELHEGDLSIGHKRVYTPDTFREEIRQAGLGVQTFGGVFIKILSNAQTQATFDAEQLRALLAIGERYPEIAAEMYVVATNE
jgi:2-polyprenyl-3-methyl-5-hydroxy-6-metoxy-1,4-benzoquinol methylase